MRYLKVSSHHHKGVIMVTEHETEGLDLVIKLTYPEELTLKQVNEYWAKYNLNIIYDGHHPVTGKRVHVVKEDLYLCIVDNAHVFGLNNLQQLSEHFGMEK